MRRTRLVMDEYQFDEAVRKITTVGGGPIAPYTKESQRKILSRRMEALVRRPFPDAQAHHDFPWKHQEWFAGHGIDVNNPAFGRWLALKRHIEIEKQLPITYEKYWDNIRAEERTRVANGQPMFTFDNLFERLGQARSEYPATTIK